jgi:hypothetical protein
MLTIRDAQMQAFGAMMLDSFVDRTVARVAREHPARYEAMGPDATRALVRQGIARAKTYTIEETGAVGAFIDLMVTLHPEFEKQPDMEDVMDILTDYELSDETRMQMVGEELAGTSGLR